MTKPTVNPMQQIWPADKTERVSVKSLVPYANNARTHSDEQIAQIMSSIREWGFTTPILRDDSGMVIAGHGRLLAAMRLGLEDVPVMTATGWSESQKKAYVIADNRLALSAGWDDDLLSVEIGDLDESGFDLDLLGFDAGEIGDLLAGEEDEDAGADTEPQDDRAEELREKWGVETGQLWQLGEHRLLCGDSTKAADVERALDGANPHLMVTDPPYGVEYNADWRNKALRNDGSPSGGRAIGVVENDDIADWSAAWRLFDGDVAYVWHAPGALSAVVCKSLQDCGFNIRMQIIWGKSHFPIGRGDYHVKHEPCWYAVRKGKTGHWNGDRTQTTLWEIDKPVKSETGHSTQKPLECMAKPVENNSKPGDFVYEPFSGSGTTIIACENLGRKCRAIEISPAYTAVAIQRWADHTGGEPELVASCHEMA